MVRELVAGIGDLPAVRVEVSLSCSTVGMARDLLKQVQTHPGIGHPGEAGVPEVVASQVFVAEFGDHFVPVRGIAQNAGSDPSTARADEQAGIGVVFADEGNAVEDQLSNFLDQWHVAEAVALGSFVVESAGTRSRPSSTEPSAATARKSTCRYSQISSGSSVSKSSG